MRPYIWILAALLVVLVAFLLVDTGESSRSEGQSGSETNRVSANSAQESALGAPEGREQFLLPVEQQTETEERVTTPGTRARRGAPAPPRPTLDFVDPPIPDSPAFRIRWRNTGLCEDTVRAEKARAIVREKFHHIQEQEVTYYIDPALEVGVRRIEPMVDQGKRLVKEFLDIDVPQVTVFVYRDRKLLQATSCVPDHVIAYYDGAIHIIWQTSEALVAESFTHEFVHHALFSEKIFAPMWLHEGAAILISGEDWWRKSERIAALEKDPLPVNWMVQAFPYSSNEEFALRVYTQAASMTTLIGGRAGNGVISSTASSQPLIDLVKNLKSGATSPEDAFSFALGMPAADATRLWRQAIPAQARE